MGYSRAVHSQGHCVPQRAARNNNGLGHRLKRWVELLVYRRAAHAIALSRPFAEILAARYNYPNDRIHVIPGGIDVGRFAVAATRQQARRRLDWPMASPVIVAVRRLVPRMGLENLIAAIAMLKSDFADIKLMIAGRGVLHAALTAQIETLGLADNILLLGFVSDDDLPYLYRAADLTVVPTVALEGFGLVAAESLAAGTPCLVSPVGGLPEVVTALSNDLVLASPAAADIAQKLKAVFTGELDLPDSERCRAYAAKHFDWRIIAARVADVYRQAIG